LSLILPNSSLIIALRIDQGADRGFAIHLSVTDQCLAYMPVRWISDLVAKDRWLSPRDGVDVCWTTQPAPIICRFTLPLTRLARLLLSPIWPKTRL